MNVFEAVKQSVTTRQAAEHYGIHVGRNGMVCCPFHHDKTPSMKLDRRYHCFGCGADGDVIDFAAALYGLGKKEAAIQLANDFGLSYEDWKPPGKVSILLIVGGAGYPEGGAPGAGCAAGGGLPVGGTSRGPARGRGAVLSGKLSRF